jgi:hypothetical protein
MWMIRNIEQKYFINNSTNFNLISLHRKSIWIVK